MDHVTHYYSKYLSRQGTTYSTQIHLNLNKLVKEVSIFMTKFKVMYK